jgi:hypothetical protein
MRPKSRFRGARLGGVLETALHTLASCLINLVGPGSSPRGLDCKGAAEAGSSLLGASRHQATRSCHLLRPIIQRMVRAVAGMERAVQQEAAPETAAPPTAERQREQHHVQESSHISPRDPRLQLSSPAETQMRTTPAQLLRPGSAAAGADSGSLVSDESEQGQAESSDSQPDQAQPAGSEGQQGAEERSQQHCSHCGSSAPVGKWYRHPTTRALLCHACRGYARTNTGHLPSAAMLQRRVQQRKAVPPNQRQCLKCGASTCRSSHGHWHRHPVNKEEWMCHVCYNVAHNKLQRQRQQEAAAAAPSSDGNEGSWQEGEEAQPPSQSPPASQQPLSSHPFWALLFSRSSQQT